jgi:hypothetical protein
LEHSNLLTLINSTEVPIVYTPYNSLDLPNIARFVNGDIAINWSRKDLPEAFRFLLYFSNIFKEQITKLEDVFTIGQQTPNSIYNINACVLYRLLKNKGASTTINTNINQMAACYNYIHKSTEVLIDYAKIAVEELNRDQLLSIISQSNIDLENKNVEVEDSEMRKISSTTSMCETVEIIDRTNYDILHEHFNRFNDIETIRKEILPISHSDAVILGALNYNLDLSNATNPIKVYSFLLKNGKLPTDIFEIESIDIELYKLCKCDLNSLNLKRRFSLLFPREYYRDDLLYDMAINEGFSIEELRYDDPYSSLQFAYFERGFYPLNQVKKVKKCSLIYAVELEDVNPNLVICYGVKGFIMDFFTPEELSESFKINLNFENPINKGEFFNKRMINKLLIICREMAELKEYRELETQMQNVITFSNEKNKAAKELLVFYNSREERGKSDIIEALQCTLELGMSMRGWLGSEYPYPIEIAMVNKNDIGKLDIFICKKIYEFYEKTKELSIVSDLPLVKYRNGIYVVSSDEDDGLTILDRINIVEDGENDLNISGCIRISSNWIVSSAYRYLSILGMKPDFDIVDLAYIS